MIRFNAVVHAVALAAAIFMSTSETALAHESPSQLMRCEDRSTVLEFLAKKYNEKIIATGVTTTGSMLELMISPRGETWTLLLSSAGSGVSCLIAAGANWRRAGQPVGHDKDRPD